MWVTAYTDASFKERKHGGTGGGWAVWLRSELGRVVDSGPAPAEIDDSLSAELYAVYRAIARARSHFGDSKVTGVQINSDCLAVRSYIWPWSNGKTARPSLRYVKELIAQERDRKNSGLRPILLRFKHVKGHQGDTGETRAWLNNKVDGYAGRHTGRMGRKSGSPPGTKAPTSRGAAG